MHRNDQQEQSEAANQRPRIQRGKVSSRLPVPKHIKRPPYVNSPQAPTFVDDYQIQDAEGIVGMKAAGLLAARVLNYAGTLVQVISSPFSEGCCAVYGIRLRSIWHIPFLNFLCHMRSIWHKTLNLSRAKTLSEFHISQTFSLFLFLFAWFGVAHS